MELREIKEYADLNGWSVTVIMLKRLFNYVSFAKNSAPTQGSLTLPIERLNENNDTEINKVIIHNNKELTLVTNQGWLRFINI